MTTTATPKKHVKISFINTAHLTHPHAHGTHKKTLFVCHETVSYDIVGLADINGVENYLGEEGYAIHGMTDLEGHKAWSFGCGDDVYYQAGGVNDISVGVEQVSIIPLLLQQKKITVAQAKKMWHARDKQLHATAILAACWHQVDPKNHPLKYVTGSSGAQLKGVTTHWDVSQHHKESDGHSDCHPAHKGGYYPILEVIEFAKVYVKLGYHF